VLVAFEAQGTQHKTYRPERIGTMFDELAQLIAYERRTSITPVPVDERRDLSAEKLAADIAFARSLPRLHELFAAIAQQGLAA
jgi:hypothetical protein